MAVSLRTRIVVYVLALALAAGAFVFVGILASLKRSLWIGRLQRWEVESAESTAECKAAVRELHFKLLRYGLSRAPEDRLEFTRAEEALARWIDERSREMSVPETRQIFGEIAVAFAGYRRRAHELLERPPVPGNDPSAREMLDRIESDANLIVAVDGRLRAAQRESLQALVARARADVEWIWRLFYACMLALFVCGAVLARIVYRDLIAPLRFRVARSRVLLERQEKLTALGLLLAGIAHEIRNPLNSIKARLFTQRRLLGANSPGLEDNEFIEGEIDRLEGVVEGSLQFARPAAPAFRRQPLRPALESLCDLARPTLKKADIELRTEFGPDQEVSFDGNQLRQALLNLLNNAVESIGRSGVITVRARPATLTSLRKRLAGVAIEVQDSGPGVPSHVHPRLFDPFFTTKENGTGLGLPITARIAHAHGGWIECESNPGRGALFRILLPTEPSHETDPHPAH